MREYNNQDVKIDENELDPCIAAEIRMKKALFSQQTRRNLSILFIVIIVVIFFSVLLLFLLSRTNVREILQKNASLPETNAQISNASKILTEIPIDSIDSVLNSSSETTAESFTIATENPAHITDSIIDSFSEATVVAATVATTEIPLDSIDPVSSFLSKATVESSTEIPTDSTHSVEHFPSETTAATTVETTVTTTTVNIANFFENFHDLLKPERNVVVNATNISPLTENDKETEESIIPSSFIDSNDNDNANEDCKALLANGKTESGIYQIFLPKVGNINVLCDMTTNGGGWTVIQKRLNGQVYFANRTWNEYENGFGDLTSSFWLGLDKIYALTSKENGNPSTLRIELRGDLCEDQTGCSKKPNGYWWGEWDFNIGDATQKYTLSISTALAGNLSERTTTDRFHYMNNGKSFTTIDQDNDRFQGNCAQFRDFGGWWHNDCGYVALNGRYGDRTSKMRNMFWFYGSGTRPFINYYIKPRETEMKLRSNS